MAGAACSSITLVPRPPPSDEMRPETSSVQPPAEAGRAARGGSSLAPGRAGLGQPPASLQQTLSGPGTSPGPGLTHDIPLERNVPWARTGKQERRSLASTVCFPLRYSGSLGSTQARVEA